MEGGWHTSNADANESRVGGDCTPSSNERRVGVQIEEGFGR